MIFKSNLKSKPSSIISYEEIWPTKNKDEYEANDCINLICESITGRNVVSELKNFPYKKGNRKIWLY